MDRRKKRTANTIRKAFIDLMNELGLNNITVRALAEKADINRGTFYLHFKDINDLLEKLKLEIITDLNQITQKIDPNEIIDDQDKLYPYLVEIIESFADHADLVSVLISPNGDPSFLITWEQMISNLVLLKSDEVPDDKKYTSMPQNYLSTIIASIYTSVILEWIDTGMKESPEDIAAIISKGSIEPIILHMHS